MPATPGTSTDVTIDPSIGFVASTTWDPFVGIEAGRTYVAPAADPGRATQTTKSK